MKINTCEAAKRLAVHPSHLFLHVAQLDASLTFEDVWPEIDQDWVETVSISGRHRRMQGREGTQFFPEGEPAAAGPDFSVNAVHVVDKLRRHGKWGSVSVTFDALINLTHLSKHGLEEAIAELRRKDLLDRDGTGQGTISLRSARREDIESM